MTVEDAVRFVAGDNGSRLTFCCRWNCAARNSRMFASSMGNARASYKSLVREFRCSAPGTRARLSRL